MADTYRNHKSRWLWVPAFAGTTVVGAKSHFASALAVTSRTGCVSSSLRTQGPLRRGLCWRHGRKRLLPLSISTPVVMGPCFGRDDSQTGLGL